MTCSAGSTDCTRRERPGQPNLDARIASYELAARMQLAATDALDLSQETAATHEMYGIGHEPTDSYGRRCLIARRLVERGVRFVQLFINQQIWDNHTELADGMKEACERTDLPIAALLAGSETARPARRARWSSGAESSAACRSRNCAADKDERHAGRDHNKNAFCTWLAGGGVKAGITLRRNR